MAMGYGAESIGLRMAELSSAVAANIKYALDRLKEGRDPATVTAAEMVVAYADASEQSAQMMAYFAGVFAAEGNVVESELCLAWSQRFSGQSESLRSALMNSGEDDDVIRDIVISTFDVYEDTNVLDDLIGRGAGRTRHPPGFE